MLSWTGVNVSLARPWISFYYQSSFINSHVSLCLHVISANDTSMKYFMLLCVFTPWPHLLSLTGSRLHCIGCCRGSQEAWADKGGEACAQLYDGHTAHQTGKHTHTRFNKWTRRHSFIFREPYMYQFSFYLGPFQFFMHLKDSKIAPCIKYVSTSWLTSVTRRLVINNCNIQMCFFRWAAKVMPSSSEGSTSLFFKSVLPQAYSIASA